MRLIDADDLYTVCKEVAENDCLTDGAAVEVLDIVCEAMANTKTIDAVEVVRGKWNIIMERAGKSCLALCSICGAQETAPSRVALVFGHRYCCYCGAKMEGTDANT